MPFRDMRSEGYYWIVSPKADEPIIAMWENTNDGFVWYLPGSDDQLHDNEIQVISRKLAPPHGAHRPQPDKELVTNTSPDA